ncbi:MAG: tRNA (adenosine(37)-N6)-dimethylallyltransferase MiaA [Anaerolineales bacterium]
MPLTELQPPLIIILGPTAVGKTEISIELAESLDGEIISADSRLFYRGMDIGTAKPSSLEQARVPHHFIDIADPDQIWSLEMFRKEAHRTISDIVARGRVPFMVGGTGQYVRAVIEEWDIPRVAPNPKLRQVLYNWAQEIGADGLHNRLLQLDPVAAEQIDSRNLRRTIRALEVILLSGRHFSTQKTSKPSRYRILQIGLTRPRSELYARIDARIDAMLSAGFAEEVQVLLDAGYSADLPSLSAIGYRQMVEYLQGNIDLEEAITMMKRNTRKFVRRQANWFRLDDPNICWFQMGPETKKSIEYTIKEFLDM